MNACKQEVDVCPFLASCFIELPAALLIELVDGLCDNIIAGINMKEVSCFSA